MTTRPSSFAAGQRDGASLKVACAGDETRGLGHPKVWLQISPETGYVDCGYCDKRFIIDRDHIVDDH